MEEIWKPVTGFELDYEVSNLGRVKRISPNRAGNTRFVGHIIKPMMRTRGYLGICLWKDRKPHSKLIHRIVMETFVGPRGNNTTNHKNGIKIDNMLDNLEYVTHSENIQHALNVLKSFRPRSGETHHRATISDVDMISICNRLDAGERPGPIASEFGVAYGTIRDFRDRNGRSKNVTKKSSAP
jgi:hypothetical protein